MRDIFRRIKRIQGSKELVEPNELRPTRANLKDDLGRYRRKLPLLFVVVEADCGVLNVGGEIEDLRD